MRERAAAVCDQPGSGVVAVETRSSVSVSFMEKLLHRQRTAGSVPTLPSAPALKCAYLSANAGCLRQEPDATLTELGNWLATIGGPAVSATTL